MNGGTKINVNDLLDTLDKMLPVQFNRLLLNLDIPSELMPSEDMQQMERVTKLLLWAKAPGGCGLENIQQALETMRITLGTINLIKKDFNEIYRIAQNRLFNFDHKVTLETFKEIVEKLAGQENAGIFILPKCLSQGGYYCPQRLINYLKDPSVTAQGKFHLKNINYLIGEQTLKGLLCRLGRELKVERKLEQELEELTENDLIDRVIEQIYNSIPKNDAGNTYLFHVKGYDRLLKEKSFWDLFINNFWNVFIKQLSSVIKQHRRLKLVFLFESMIDIEVDLDYLCGCSKTFSREKIVELPLKPCTLEEIETWLCDCSTFPLNMINNMLDILRYADDRDRQPDRVYRYLENELIQFLQNV